MSEACAAFDSVDTEAADDVGESLDMLYRAHAPALLRRCRQILRDEALAQDAVQDTFVKALRYGSLKAVETPSAWLYRIAERCCFDRLARERRIQRCGDLDLNDDAAPELEQQTMSRQLASDFLSRLDEKSRTIAVRHYIDERHQEDIADTLGCSRRTVYNKLAEIKRCAQRYSLRLGLMGLLFGVVLLPKNEALRSRGDTAIQVYVVEAGALRALHSEALPNHAVLRFEIDLPTSGFPCVFSVDARGTEELYPASEVPERLPKGSWWVPGMYRLENGPTTLWVAVNDQAGDCEHDANVLGTVAEQPENALRHELRLRAP